MPDKTKVLIVDDERGIRALLTRWLTAWGYETREAGSAVEALDLMAAEPAAIMLCDISMPEYDGFWLAGQVMARWPETAIIMATAHDAVEVVQISRKLGAAAYVTKPFDADLVRQAVDRSAGRLHFRPSAERS